MDANRNGAHRPMAGEIAMVVCKTETDATNFQLNYNQDASGASTGFWGLV